MSGRRISRYGRALRELLYLLVTLPLAGLGFALVVVALVGGALSIVALGVPILVVVLTIIRRLPQAMRRPARALLGWTWADPPPVGRSLRARLSDGPAWRALAYAAARLPLTLVGLYLPAALMVGVVLVLIDGSSGWTVLGIVQVVVVVVAMPWFISLVVTIDRTLATALLAPPADAARVLALESGRAALTADAVATGRRVERDLHDGTQARLVAIGIQLSRLEARTAEATTRQLAGEAKHAVADALSELRDIISGIRPPALDDGLGVALAGLAARSPVPTSVVDELEMRPSDETATGLYFAASELLTNVARHANATTATVELGSRNGVVALTVRDDGHGGATVGSSMTGLVGLRQRIEALDGTMTIDSPAGGPTHITVTLPASSPT